MIFQCLWVFFFFLYLVDFSFYENKMSFTSAQFGHNEIQINSCLPRIVNPVYFLV